MLHINLNSYTHIKNTYLQPSILKKYMHTHTHTKANVNHPTHVINQDSLPYERAAAYKTVISIVNM